MPTNPTPAPVSGDDRDALVWINAAGRYENHPPALSGDPYLDHGNTGSTETIDASVATVHRIVLDSATVTLTFSGAVSGRAVSFSLIVVQDGTGGRAVVWPGSVLWPGGTDAVISTAANAVDLLTFMSVDGGTSWAGMIAGQAFAT